MLILTLKTFFVLSQLMSFGSIKIEIQLEKLIMLTILVFKNDLDWTLLASKGVFSAIKQ